MALILPNTNTDELFQLMKAQMTTEQEQLFMVSHYLYLEHGDDNTKFVVDFDIVWKNVDFSRRDNAKRLLEKNFTENIDYKMIAPLLGGAINHTNLRGGLNKETILLTVDCFKCFCMIAATPKAKVVRSYYIKMENIMHEYYKRFESRSIELTTALQQSQKETAIKRHEVLIESNKNKCVVYFCKIKTNDDGSFILKVGETINIKNRMEALRCDFGQNTMLLDVIVCENSTKLEKMLHNSTELTKYKYRKLAHKNKKLSTEAYLIPTQTEYESIVKYGNQEAQKYNSIEFTRLRVEEKRIDLITSLLPLCNSYEKVMSIIDNMNKGRNDTYCSEKEREHQPLENTVIGQDNNENIDNDDEDENETEAELDAEEIQQTTSANPTGPIVQIYHKDDLTKLVQVYTSIMEATRNFNYNNKTASFTAIKRAYQHKTLYLDYRWHFITNRQDPTINLPQNIGKTVITQERNQGQVAMLNIDKTKIIKVFKLAKDAAKEILQHPSAMCTAIKHSSPLNNHYWMRWENLDSSLQEDFLRTNTLPIKSANVRGTQIKATDPITNQLVKTFASYTDLQKELNISIKTIKKLIENNDIYNGKYRFVVNI